MSTLPPAGRRLRDDVEASPTVGLGKQFTKGQVDRRRGASDRRHIQAERRVGQIDRRAQPAAVQSSGVEPLHVQDEAGRTQPNPAAPVTGVSDSERQENAAASGVLITVPPAAFTSQFEPRSQGIAGLGTATGVSVINPRERRFFQQRSNTRSKPTEQLERRSGEDRRATSS